MEGKTKSKNKNKTEQTGKLTPNTGMSMEVELELLRERLAKLEKLTEVLEPQPGTTTKDENEEPWFKADIEEVENSGVFDTKYVNGTPIRVCYVEDQLWLLLPVKGCAGVWYPINRKDSTVTVDPAAYAECEEYLSRVGLTAVVPDYYAASGFVGGAAAPADKTTDKCSGHCDGGCGKSCRKESTPAGWERISPEEFAELFARLFI